MSHKSKTRMLNNRNFSLSIYSTCWFSHPLYFSLLLWLSCFFSQVAQSFLYLQQISVLSKEPLPFWTAMLHMTLESISGPCWSISFSWIPLVSPHTHSTVYLYVSLCCSFKWDRGGVPVLPTSGGRVSVRQGSLTIGQTWSGDIGDYTCTVTSQAGNDSRSARLEVM